MLKKRFLFLFILLVGGVVYLAHVYPKNTQQFIATIHSGHVLGVSTHSVDVTDLAKQVAGKQLESVKEKGMNVKLGDVVNGFSYTVKLVHTVLDIGGLVHTQITGLVKHE